MSKKHISPARRTALLNEAYRIGMQQVLPEIEGFADLLIERSVANFIEIGSNKGGLSFLLSHLTCPGLRLVLDNVASRARSQMFAALPGEVHEVVADSHAEETLSEIERRLAGRQVDLLFIDGDHSYQGVTRDYLLYRHLVRPGGMIAFHDIRAAQYNASQKIESPRFWAELTADMDQASFQEFLAAPHECALPAGNWDWSLDYSRQNDIPALWGGIGVVFTSNSAKALPGTSLDEPNPYARQNGLGENAESGSRRPFLVYCPVDRGDFLAELDNPNRLFDVALNDFSGEGTGLEFADWKFATRSHKWPGIAINLEAIDHSYEYVAFIDNDITISTEQINILFLTGYALGLDLFQASLSDDSITAWSELKQRSGSYVRGVKFVEIMMPIFSRSGLDACQHTFGLSTTGWGLDLVWAKILNGLGMAVFDAVVAGHRRPVCSNEWRNDRGQSAGEEMKAVCASFGI